MPPLAENSDVPSRYLVGIDLGTTNSAVAMVDTEAPRWTVVDFPVPQLVAPGQVEARETLPSFHYQAAPGEFPAGALRLPWSSQEPDHAVGVFARDHGERVPGRLIASAKSWLSHSGVDRTADLLPWHAAPEVARLSPVEATARYLAHIRGAWNDRFPKFPLEQQDVVLTLPASFDEVARELTVKAAHLAGLPRVVLLEEPQAAFYAWIYARGEQWEDLVRPGQKILVCDIGGGTSDFTLIRVRADRAGRVQFHRVAVGEHLILGGDNLDLALAHHLEQRVGTGEKLSPRQWSVLVQAARRVKENLLGPAPPARLVVNLPGAGSRLIGGGLQIEVTREEAEEVLVEGFLPRVPLDARPIARRSGFQEFGLPYAPDAAITRYLAAFLTAHRHSDVALPNERAAAPNGDTSRAADGHDPARPDVVLLNGGFFAAPGLRSRLLQVVESWFGPAGWKPQVLHNDRLDLAVARGAAYYGMVRRGVGVRIAAGLARSYYIGVETGSSDGSATAVCLLPAGIEEGQSVDLHERRFNLWIRQPVEFPLYVSSTRLTDPPGALVGVDPEQMTLLPPIRTVLTAGKKTGGAELLPVELHARLTEIGTLELWCSEAQGKRTWRLEFDVRAATRTDLSGHQGTGERAGVVDQSLVEACRELLRQTFAGGGTAAASPEGLVKRLEQTSEMRRTAWPPSLLRALWETLFELEAGRRRSAEHEARWLYLVGFCLRPGYGMAVDDWRVAQTWRLLQGRLVHSAPMCRVEALILWRRIAGGLTAGQQRALCDPLQASLPTLWSSARPGRKGAATGGHEVAEAARLLGSCELLPLDLKTVLGETLLARAEREKAPALLEAEVWAVGRMGAREPMYGPLNGVLPPETVERWIDRLVALEADALPFALMQLARRTGDRYRDLGEARRRKVVDWLAAQQAPGHLQELVSEGGELAEEEQGLVFGESLPRGLSLR